MAAKAAAVAAKAADDAEDAKVAAATTPTPAAIATAKEKADAAIVAANEAQKAADAAAAGGGGEAEGVSLEQLDKDPAHHNTAAYNIVKAIFDKRDDLIAVHKEAANIKLENQKAGATPIPFHPGAAKYFAEKGIKLD